MPLRVRFFLWISSVFFLVMVVVYLFGEFEVIKEMKELRNNVRSEAVKNVIAKKQNYEKFLESRIMMNEVWLGMTLQSFKPWMISNFIPNQYNINTSSWISLSQLLVLAPWMDFMQCRINEKLTASIISKTPFVHNLVEIQYNDKITFFISGHKDQRLSLYVGVPYWDMKNIEFKNSDKKMIKKMGAPEKHWLLYDIGRLLSINERDFHLESIPSQVNPFQSVSSISNDAAFYQILQTAKDQILNVKNALAQEKSLLNVLTSKNREDWTRRELEKHFSYDQNEIKKCYEELCSVNEFITSNKSAIDYENQSHNKVILSRLVWQFNVMNGHKFLNSYDPLNEKMPNGLVKVTQEHANVINTIGKGFFAKEIFNNTLMPVKNRCVIDPNDLSCFKNTNEVIFDKTTQSYYITGTVYIKQRADDVNETAISLGMHLQNILEVMALYSSAKIYLMNNENFILGINEDGSVIPDHKLNETHFELNEKLAEDVAFSLDNKQNRSLYLLLRPFKDKTKTILCVEYHDLKYYNLFDKFSEHTQEKLYHISLRIGIFVIIGFLIGLFIIDRVIRNITIPIQSLAKASHMIGKGRLDYLKFMNVKSLHHDEIGKLYQEFILMVEKMKRGKKVESVLNKVVSKEIGEEILKRGKINLKGELRRGTVLFADMVKCTELSQEETPIDFLKILNQSFGVLSRVIEDHHGVIDKYIGDAVMSLFGIPIEDEHQELHATLAGLEMLKMITEMNIHRQNLGEKKIDFGIGIHAGEVVAGNIGAKNRLNYTVVGYPVNSASRICNYAKGGEVLISDAVADAKGVRELIELEFHSEISLKGMFKPIKIYKALERKNS